MTGSRPKRGYFIGQRGWLDLLGSIPSFGVFQLTALLRLARLSRLARIRRLLRRPEAKELIEDISTTAASTRRSSRSCRVHGAVRVEHARAAVREQVAGRQHQDRRRRAVVGRRDDHHGRLRRLLPGDDARSADRRVRDVRGRRHHRRPRQHPGEPPRAAGQAAGGRRGIGGAGRPAPRRRPSPATSRDQGSAAILAQLADLRAEVRALREAVRGEPAEPPPARTPMVRRRRPRFRRRRTPP